MVGISGGGGGGGGGYNYVQDAEPSAPEEGEEWYDTGANAAFVYDGAAWIEQTVADHGQLTGVSESNHHSRYTDAEAQSAINTAMSYSDMSGAENDNVNATNTVNSNTTTRTVFNNGEGVFYTAYLRVEAEHTGSDEDSSCFAKTYARLKMEFEDASVVTIGSAGVAADAYIDGRKSSSTTVTPANLDAAGTPKRLYLECEYVADSDASDTTVVGDHRAEWQITTFSPTVL